MMVFSMFVGSYFKRNLMSLREDLKKNRKFSELGQKGG